MTIRIRRVADGVIFSWTEVLAKKKGFIEFDDEPKKEAPGVKSGPLSLDEMDRKQIGKFILNKYDIQIPKMNRTKEAILVDAYKIIEEYAVKEAKDKENAEHKEAHDKLQEDRKQSALNTEKVKY